MPTALPVSTLGLLFGLLAFIAGYLFSGQVEIRSLSNNDLPEDGEIFNFGPAKVRGASTFRRTPLSLAFVNKKPVVTGHVLVVPRRAVARMEELEEKEVTDLFLLVQRVDVFLQRHYGVDSTTISIQSESRPSSCTFKLVLFFQMVLVLVKQYPTYMCTYFPEDLVTSHKMTMCTLDWQSMTRRRVGGGGRMQWHMRRPR